MQLSRTARLRTALAALLFAGAVALPLVVPSHVSAQGVPQSPKGWSREAVLRNAQRWVDQQIGYSQTSWYRGYRQDCSGFVSMAWNVHASYPTGMMGEIARPIPKEALLPGDVLLNASSSYAHVVLFARWAYTDKSWYVGYEQIGSAGHPVRRLIPYPYFRHAELYVPYRFIGVPPKPAPRPAPVALKPAQAPRARAVTPTRTAERSKPWTPGGVHLALAMALAMTVGLAWGLTGRGIR
jgi:hypothetical protein